MAAPGTNPGGVVLLPEPGGIFTDPEFGTRIMRITGPAEGKWCTNVYSIWPTFNADSTAMLVLCDPDNASTEWLFRFDPANFRIISKERVPVRLFLGYGSEWSRRNPAIHYYASGNQIRAYNIGTRQSVLVKDFTADVGPGNLARMQMSDDDDVFSAVRLDSNWAAAGCLVWRRSDNRILFRSNLPDLKPDSDKTGSYMLLPPDLPGYRNMFLNTLTGQKEYLVNGAPDYGPGHNDMGAASMVNWDNWDNRLLARSLATPHTWTQIFQFPTWSHEVHISLATRDEAWALVSTASAFPQTVQTDQYKDLLFLVATDGSRRVRKIAHTRNDQFATGTADYWDTPRANMSFDGRFAAYTSNWGTLRRDMFVAEIAEPGSTPPPAPSGLAAAAGPAQVSLGWTASAGATSYSVSRGTVSGGPYSVIATGLTATSYADTAVASGTTYYYVVRSANANGSSPYSNQASAAPMDPAVPAAPKGLAATPGRRTMRLSWKASPGATSYNVKRSRTSGGPYTVVASGVTTTTYTNTGLQRNTRYYYVVSGVNASGEGPNSNEANARAQ